MTNEKAALKEKLRIDVERFKERGGIIRQLGNGETENDINAHNKFINKARIKKAKGEENDQESN